MTLPELANIVGGQNWNEVLDALRRMHEEKTIGIRKWTEVNGFVLYDSDSSTEFFARGSFQVKITPRGRIYEEALEEQERSKQAIENGSQTIAENIIKPRDFLPGALFSAEATANLSKFGMLTEEAFSKSVVFRESFQDAIVALGPGGVSSQFLEGLSNIAIDLKPVMDSYTNISAHLAKQLDLQNIVFATELITAQWAEPLMLIAGQAKAIAEATISLPAVAAMTWPTDILSARIGLIEDSLKNVDVWQKLRGELIHLPEFISQPLFASEILNVAGQFVVDYGEFVRQLPPQLPLPQESHDEDEDLQIRDQEVGTRLEAILLRLDKNLRMLRRRAWENLAKGDPASARLAAHGIREIYGDVLRRLAPDNLVMKTEMWEQRADQTLTRPTRRMRIEFVVGTKAAKFDALTQFDESISEANKFAHTFADNTEIVRVYMAQLENCLYLILTHANSN